MKLQKMTLFVAVACVSLLAWGSVAQAIKITNNSTIIFEEPGFELDTDGSTPGSATTGSWSFGSTNPTVISAATAGFPARTGNNMLRIADNNAQAFFNWTPDPVGGDSLSISFSFRIQDSTVTPEDDAGQMGIYGVPLKWLSDGSMVHRCWSVLGNCNIPNGDPEGDLPLGGASPATHNIGEWNDVTINKTIGTTTMEVILNGTTYNAFTGDDAGRLVAPITLGITNGEIDGLSSHPFYIDSVPEPGSVLLLGMGLLGLLGYGWRRR